MCAYKLNEEITVPVIMYHSIGIHCHNWLWKHLSMPFDLFEKQIKILSQKGFQTINLSELFNYRKYNKKIPSSSIVLTFDDGYLDNWVYAFPVLKKYGFKGTIFVNPEFIDPREDCRPNLEGVWRGEYSKEELESKGFLSWEELKQMEKEGIMDIQSHSMTHTWYFSHSEIVDFHHPGNTRYPWLFWNARPDRKSFYLNENQESFIDYGTPIYRHGRSLGIKKYFEDKGLTRYLIDFVKIKGLQFFEKSDWKSILFNQVDIYKSQNKLHDRYETDEEQDERYRYELFESKEILEEKLNKRIKFLCWAGGAYDRKALEIAEEAGYLSSTLLYADPQIKNTIGEDPSVINRTGCVSEFTWRDTFISYTKSKHFMANIKMFYGGKKYLWVIRIYKLLYLVRFYVTRFLHLRRD